MAYVPAALPVLIILCVVMWTHYPVDVLKALLWELPSVIETTDVTISGTAVRSDIQITLGAREKSLCSKVGMSGK